MWYYDDNDADEEYEVEDFSEETDDHNEPGELDETDDEY